ERLAFAVGAGIAEERILLDPGIGFGKTVEHTLTLLRRLDELAALGRPVVIGTSRKSFLGKLTGRPQARERVAGTVATNVLALERGATVFRVHDVARPVSDDADDLDDDRYEDDEDGSADSYVSIEIAGLSLYTHHGVTAAEQ